MPVESTCDPRVALVKDKYFTLRPKPLERWLWQQGLPQAAERVFWLHWEEGMRSGDWCSEVPLKHVARECCIDPSTVTRAYQLLKNLGLIRRADPGRDPAKPFQQATAITEVRVPRELLVELSRSPNRRSRTERERAPAETQSLAQPNETSLTDRGERPTAPIPRGNWKTLFNKLSDTERQAFFLASRKRTRTLAFDDNTVLTAEERGLVLMQLERMSRDVSEAPAEPLASQSRTTMAFARPRRLSPLDAARTRKRVLELVPAPAANETLRQVLWSVEEGALRRFDASLAVNIALKKIREGAWTRPNRMPPNWLRTAAAPEACTAA